MKKTVLYDRHLELGAKMVEFGGFLMPLEYSSIIKEHVAVRTACGLFDVSHMGEISIRGPQAADFINYLVTSNVKTIPPYRMIYAMLLHDNGGILDDLMIYKFLDDEYLLVVNAANTQRDFQWIVNHKNDYDVIITDLSNYYSLLALQGPLSQDVLQKFTNFDLNELKPLDFRTIDIANNEYIVSRSGYTGEDGFEIYGTGDGIKILFELLLQDERVTLCGLGARDTLRFEAGLPLYGNEIGDKVNPLEVGLGYAVDFSKKFIGSNSLQKIYEQGPKHKLVGLELLDRGIARTGYEVYKDGKLIGNITTGYMIPGTNKSYAMALINDLTLKNGDIVNVRIRNKDVVAKIRNKRFKNK